MFFFPLIEGKWDGNEGSPVPVSKSTPAFLMSSYPLSLLCPGHCATSTGPVMLRFQYDPFQCDPIVLLEPHPLHTKPGNWLGGSPRGLVTEKLQRIRGLHPDSLNLCSL